MMLEYMRRTEINTIVVVMLDRLTRDVEHFERLKDLRSVLGWAVEQDVEIVSIADAKFTELVNQVRNMVREMRSSLPQEMSILKPVYEMVSKMLVSVVEMLPELRISMAQAELERARRAIDRLRAEGRVYTKPTLIHWLAPFRSGKGGFSELTKDDVDSAERYFYSQCVKLYEKGVPALRLYRRFLESERPVVEFIRRRKESSGMSKNTYTSFTAFYTLLKRVNKSRA